MTISKQTPSFPQMQEFYRLVERGVITAENFQGFLEKPDRFATTVFPSQLLCPDLIPEYEDERGQKRKWRVIEDVEPPKANFKTNDLEAVRFVQEGDGGQISGELLRTRAADTLQANLGLCHLKVVLDNQAEICVELQKLYLVFTGTLLRASDDSLRVPFLYFVGGQWRLRFGRIDRNFHDGGRLVRSK